MDSTPTPPNPVDQPPTQAATPVPPEDAVRMPDEVPLTPMGWLVQNGVYLVLLVGGLIWLYRAQGWEGVVSAGLTAFGVGFIIFIHELGHFLVAKWCDVHVLTFSVGFGPAIPGCSFKRGETTYKLALLPLGGYVNMVGEGSDADEDESYPRSFKNKSVGQRMAIISAGVVMNVILGALCFMFVYRAHGVNRTRAVIGDVGAGGVAWTEGVRTGWEVVAINDNRKPTFDDLREAVTLSSKGKTVTFTFKDFEGKEHQHELRPRRSDGQVAPMIGVSPQSKMELIGLELKKDYKNPYWPHSAAASAHVAGQETGPGFEYGDVILAMSAVNKPGQPYDPNQLEPLPLDKRVNDGKARDPFAYRDRLRLLAGKPIVIQVKRAKSGAVVDILVPPAWHARFGARMKMGPVLAVRKGSPAEQAGVRPHLNPDDPTDVISGVQMRVEGVSEPILNLGDPPAAQQPIDPVRLPSLLVAAAAKHPGKKKLVTLTLDREKKIANPPPTTLPPMVWDESYDDSAESPLDPNAPMPIPQLGLAYGINSFIEFVEPGSPAARAHKAIDDKGVTVKEPDALLAGDVLTAVRFWETRGGKSGWSPWFDLQTKPKEEGKDDYRWAQAFEAMQQPDGRVVQFKVRRNKELLEHPYEVVLEEDQDWPMKTRGLILAQDQVLVKADTLWQSLVYGTEDTIRFIRSMYKGVARLITGNVSTKTLGGPMTIATVAFKAASEDIYSLILFMGILSLNLAVVNFLPIPLLDGGHMVFLIYEKIRGKPASESVRTIAAYIGLALLLALMIYVIVILEIPRFFF